MFRQIPVLVIPDIVINGGTGSDGSLNGLMGLKLLEGIEERKTSKPTKVVDVTKPVENGNGAGGKK